jgi:hypothetical protein
MTQGMHMVFRNAFTLVAQIVPQLATTINHTAISPACCISAFCHSSFRTRSPRVGSFYRLDNETLTSLHQQSGGMHTELYVLRD